MPTTNNNWPTPVATDLVKDGWEAIKDLGDAIDTTLGVYAPSTPGLTLINTTSFSAVASQSVNNVFSSTYDNYRVIIKATQNTGTGNQFFRLRVGGVDASGANYNAQGSYAGITSAVTRVNISGVTGIDFGSAGTGATASAIIIIELQDVAKATPTSGNWNAFNTTLRDYNVIGIEHTLSTAYDGFTWTTGANTMTGQIQVFGYNK
jgi:hypothetical protein